MDKSYQDKSFNNAMSFVNNMQHFKQGISNLYVFTSTDSDGNVIDEKYGMNLMTDYGFKKIFTDNASFDGSSVTVYVGNGENSFDGKTQTLESVALGGLGATKENTSKAYNYPMYYSAAENDGDGLITTISRFLVCYYPQNISNITDDVYISEYGLGTSATALWTHSHIYNIRGERSRIYKYINTKLTITVYMCLSFYEHLIQNGWNGTYNYRNPGSFANRYSLITTNKQMYDRMYESKLFTYKRNGIKYDRTSGRTQTIDNKEDNKNTVSTIMKSFILYNDTGYKNEEGYVDGFVQWNTGFHTMEPQFLDTPEEIELTNFPSPMPFNYDGFASRFGSIPSSQNDWNTTYYPSITTLFDAEAYLFNHKTGEWDIQLDIYNPDNKWYNESSLHSEFAQPIYYSNKGEIITGYLYQNLRPDDPITSIDPTIETLYATDKYWDYSSWIWIQDYSNIPQKARTAKYWIAGTKSNIGVHRESDCFQLLEKGTNSNGYEVFSGFTQKNGWYQQCSNYEYGWYMFDNTVYSPNKQISFKIGSSGETYTTSMTYGKWLVTFNSVYNKYYLTDMSGLISGTIPTPVEQTIQYHETGQSTIKIDSLTQCYRTESNTGLICMQSTNYAKANVIDLRNDNHQQRVFDWKCSTTIWNTNKIAYVPSDANEIRIFNYETNSDDGDAIPFPSGVSSVLFMYGHSNYVWFTDGSSYAYVIDLRERIPQGCENRIPFTNDLNYIKMTAVDDVFILYRYNNSNISNAYYVNINDHSTITSPKSLSPFRVDLNNRSYYISLNLRYVQDDSLLLTSSTGYYYRSQGAMNKCIDFGQYLANGSVVRYWRAFDSTSAYILYGPYMIYNIKNKAPLINYAHIKLKGKTNTISAINRIKNISGKQWLISFTNTPTWGDGASNTGTPPGVPLATTNSDGTITGWTNAK